MNNRDRRRGPKGKKGGKDQYDRSMDRTECADSTERKRGESRPNDWRWYAINEGLLRDSASYPFGWPLGNPVDLGADGLSNYYLGGAIPGVMALEICPTIGYSRNPNSPINVASRNIYSYVRHANSGHANYDSPDLMMYLVAMDSAYSMFSFMKRIYGVMRDYTATNRYYPKGLLYAMHVNFDSIQANLAQLRYFINSYAVKIGSMCVPASMSYHARHMWMYDGLYVDSTSDKAQTYMYTPNGFYEFQLDSGQKGMLRYNQIHEYYPSNLSELDFDALCTFALDIINPILTDEDMNIMSGDILKAYGPNGVVRIQGISEDYTVLPVYSEEVLNQIANSTAMGYPYTGTTLSSDDKVRVNCDIWQNVSSIPDSPYIMAFPSTQTYVSTGATDSIRHVTVGDWSPATGSLSPVDVINRLELPYSTKRILTFQHGNVEPKDVMVATRLMNIASSKTVTASLGSPLPEMGIETVGSEYVVVYNIVRYTDNGLLANRTFTSAISIHSNIVSINAIEQDNNLSYANVWGSSPTPAYNRQAMDAAYGQSLIQMLPILADLSVFDWHPIVYPQMVTIAQYKSAAGVQGVDSARVYKATNYSPMGDINYYTTLTQHDLMRMTETALLSEFSVPQAGFTLSRT